MLIQPRKDTLFPVGGLVPSPLLPWIEYQESLTRRLKDKAGEAHLQVLQDCWEPSDWWDQTVLKIKQGLVRHRKILMWAEDNPCWYARTVIPQTTFEAGRDVFGRLSSQPLSELLFGEPRIKRAYLMSYSVDSNAIEYYWVKSYLKKNESSLWVRFSAYTFLSEFHLFVIEILLPGLMRKAT